VRGHLGTPSPVLSGFLFQDAVDLPARDAHLMRYGTRPGPLWTRRHSYRRGLDRRLHRAQQETAPGRQGRGGPGAVKPIQASKRRGGLLNLRPKPSGRLSCSHERSTKRPRLLALLKLGPLSAYRLAS
jgi:hypothetical protein